MVTFTQNSKNGQKTWFVTFKGSKFQCVNQDVAKELFKLFTQRAIKEVY